MKVDESIRRAMVAAGLDPDSLRARRGGQAPKGKPTQARYRRPDEDGRNSLERAYEKHLEARKQAGEIHDFAFQPIKLLIVRGAPKTDHAEGVKASWYTPDFMVYENDETLSFHETKGFLDRAGDGWLKFKAAASLYPFAFYMVQRKKGQWACTRYAH